MLTLLSIFLSLPVLVIILTLSYKLLWIPIHIQNVVHSQGLKGPSYKFLHGNNKDIISLKKQASSSGPLDLSRHDIFPRIQPHYYSFMQLYGRNFLVWLGTRPQIVVTEPELVRKILNDKQGIYGKLKVKGHLKKLLGDGVVVAEGEKWTKLRKLANHAFHGESLKDMFPAMVSCVGDMLDGWKEHEGKEIDASEEFRHLTSDVISRTAFGSNYLEGRKIFDLLIKLSIIISRNAHNVRLFGIEKLFMSPDNIESKKIDQLLRESIMEIVKKREHEVVTGRADNFGADFLGSLLKVHHDTNPKNRISVDEIIDECKIFYFAGQETTYSLLCWSVLLLALYTDWQEKARQEVLELFGQENPTSEGISRLKTVSMIIYETLRLYSPVMTITRRVKSNVQLGKHKLPKGVELGILPLALHRNPEIWGQDVHLFKPERFAEGIAKATTNDDSMSFLPFGHGPRQCVGLNFATNEAKMTLSMILQRYKLMLSPNYVHSPHVVLTVQPQHGMQILLHPL